jgi:hypothetical protein
MASQTRLEFSSDELLANVATNEPLIVKGVRCHGGFDADGRYCSPRTLWRVPAIAAWQSQHLAISPALYDVPRDTIPPNLPSVEQAKFLLREGVREPIVRMLTEIAIIEGFGAMIRDLPVPPLASFIREDTRGTALAHLAGGLFEAHARDEAGWSEEGGHRQMWEAARDAALSNPAVSPEIYMNIIARRPPSQPATVFPQLGDPVERLIRFMVNVCAIEVFAMSTFEWAEALLSDPSVSDSPEDAANLVRYIRSDESPHVEYLRTALSEICARTLITIDGSEISGKEVVDKLTERTLRAMVRQRLNDRPAMVRELVRRFADKPDVEDFLARYDALATPWIPPERYRDLISAGAAGTTPTYS